MSLEPHLFCCQRDGHRFEGTREECLPDQNTQRTEWCHQNGWRKGVGGEVGDFTDGDYPYVSNLDCVAKVRWYAYVEPRQSTKWDFSGMRILRLRSHVVQRHASDPKVDCISLMSPMILVPTLVARLQALGVCILRSGIARLDEPFL